MEVLVVKLFTLLVLYIYNLRAKSAKVLNGHLPRSIQSERRHTQDEDYIKLTKPSACT